MEPWVALLAAAVGYLIGSFSFSRLVVRLAGPDTGVSRIEHPIPGTELRQYFRLRREDKLPSEQELAEFMGMGSMYRVAHQFTIRSLLAKLGSRSEREPN
jgi:hypothetical protein